MKAWAAASWIRSKVLAHRAVSYLMSLSPSDRRDFYVCTLAIALGMLGASFYEPDPLDVLKAEVEYRGFKEASVSNHAAAHAQHNVER